MNFFDILIVQPIFNLLIAIYSIMPWGDIGLAIVVFTVIVRFAMYPLLRSQLHQSRLIRKLQPQIVKIRKQSKGNRQQESLRMMELYKQNNVNPMRSIGMLLIQLPIFFGLFFAVRILASERGRIAEFTYDILEQLGPIKQIIENPDTFNHTMLGIIDVADTAVSTAGVNISLVIIALLAAYTQRVMTRQTMPKDENAKTMRQIMSDATKKGVEPDQAEVNAAMMNNMMKFMPILMFFIMISLPGAIAWYYMVSNVIAVLQQRRILGEDVEDMEKVADTVDAMNETKHKSHVKAKKKEKQAKEAHITRIVAKDKGNKKRKG